MALQLLKLSKVKQPLLSDYVGSPMFESQLRFITDNLFKQIKQTPELLAMLDTIVSDHFLTPVDFFDPNGKPLGPTKLKQVRQFWQDENVQGRAFKGQGTDMFIDGSSFGWHVEALTHMSTKQKEQMAKLKSLNFDIGQSAVESASMPRKISYLAASTVSIKHDATGIQYYIQEVGQNKVRWNPDQVVHIKLMELNGEVRGYSSLKAVLKELIMMFMLKDNIIAKLQNGGSPDYIIAMKGANGVSKAKFERLRTALESFSHLKKSHGNMALDTDVQVHALGTELKDMEYRELAMFVISVFALALGLPTSRVPFLMTGSGGSANKGELSGNSEDSYQGKINSRRMAWENAWNVVFRKAGFTFKFRRTNLQDDVRETTAMMNRTNNVVNIQNSLAMAGKTLTTNTLLAFLSGTKTNLTEEDVETLTIQPPVAPLSASSSPSAGMGGSNQPSAMSNRAHVTQQRSDSKKRSATNNGVSA